MNLQRHFAVLWRFRLISVGGLALGIFLAVFASYNISPTGLKARGEATWASDATLLVTQPGFPEGRVTLPTTPEKDPGQTAAGQMEAQPKDRIEYADPNRFGALADLYSQLAMSDRVRSVIPEKPKPLQIQAFALQGASGGVILPVIKLTVNASTQDGANALSEHTIDALRGVLSADQKKANIPDNSRVELRTLNESSKGYLMKGPSRTASILVLILAILGTVAVTHLLAALRDRDPNTDIEGIIDPWAPDGSGNGNGNGHAAPRPVEPVGWSGTPAPPAAWAQPPAPPRGGTSGRRTEQ
jgi:hypothetical protein